MAITLKGESEHLFSDFYGCVTKNGSDTYTAYMFGNNKYIYRIKGDGIVESLNPSGECWEDFILSLEETVQIVQFIDTFDHMEIVIG